MDDATKAGSSTHAGPVTATEEPATTVLASAATALTVAGGTSAARYGSVRNMVADLPRGERSALERMSLPTMRRRMAILETVR